jgi:hypothetical protein
MPGKLLVHCCCVHCSAYTLKYWREQGYEVTAFWYNPNIHPFTEHQRRLEALNSFTDSKGIILAVAPGYDLDGYLQAAAGRGAERCPECYRLRLEAAAGYAREQGFEGFTSSLLISPQQQHQRIVEVAGTISAASGVGFFYADLRKRYSDSRRLTKPMELHRQQYCGCLFSEYERASRETAAR